MRVQNPLRWLGQLIAAAMLAGAVAASSMAANLAGPWEIQSLGQDRDLTIEQKGNKLTVHRVMWPTFQGETYKLEHLYRGRIKGTAISGQLFVREEGVPGYEPLRPFTGSIDTDQRLLLDGMPVAKK